MSKICGIVQKDNFKNKNIIKLMQQTLDKKYIPDSKLYLKDNIALGCDYFETSKYVILFDGNIYNKRVLKDVLVSRKCIDISLLNEITDKELALYLYIEFKEKMLEYINGIFSIAILDKETKGIFIARDRLGIKPLYYSFIQNEEASTFLFSSYIKAILSTGIIQATLTKDELLELFALGPAHTPSKTYFKDIYELEAGHYIEFIDNTFKKVKYWDLCEKKMFDTEEDMIRSIKYLVTDSIQKQMDGITDIGTMLSGGLDSSIVTKVVSDNVEKVDTFSINYEDNDKDFTPSAYQASKDSDYVKIMTKYLDTNHKNIDITQKELFDSLYEAVILRDMPGMADIDSSMYVFADKIFGTGKKIVMSGECSDEIFAGYPWYYKDHLKNTSGFPWALSENLRESLIRKDLITPGEVKEYVLKSKNEILKDVKHISNDEFENKFKELNYLTIKYFMNTLIERTDRMSNNNLEVRVPFADYRIFEYVYNIDAKSKLGLHASSTPTEKYLLKKAFKEDLPTCITERKKSPFPKTYSSKYLTFLEKKILDLIDDTDSKIHEIMNINYLKSLVETHGCELKENLFGQLMTYPQTLAYIIQIEYWLNAYDIKISLT